MKYELTLWENILFGLIGGIIVLSYGIHVFKLYFDRVYLEQYRKSWQRYFPFTYLIFRKKGVKEAEKDGIKGGA